MVAKDQAVLELETDKATIEVPSSVAGRVTAVKVKAGDKVQGRSGGARGSRATALLRPTQPSTKPTAQAAAPPAPTVARRWAPTTVRQHREPAEARSPAASAPRSDRSACGRDKSSTSVVAPGRARNPPRPTTPRRPPHLRSGGWPASSASRSTTSLAPDPSGRISIDDVKAYAKRLIGSGQHAGSNIAAEPLPDFSRWGAIDRQPMRAVRRKTAEHLSAAWTTIPHVTQHELADVTALEELRKRYAKQAEAAGGNLTVTADRREGRRDGAEAVPAVQRVDRSGCRGDHLQEVRQHRRRGRHRSRAARARSSATPTRRTSSSWPSRSRSCPKRRATRKISLDEMQGGCFSISNLGGIGGTYFTPIVNSPEVAILGISRGRMQAGLQGRPVRAAADAAAVAVLRPSRDRRRRRHAVPALGRRRAGAAVPAGAARMSASIITDHEAYESTRRVACFVSFVSSCLVMSRRQS